MISTPYLKSNVKRKRKRKRNEQNEKNKSYFVSAFVCYYYCCSFSFNDSDTFSWRRFSVHVVLCAIRLRNSNTFSDSSLIVQIRSINLCIQTSIKIRCWNFAGTKRSNDRMLGICVSIQFRGISFRCSNEIWFCEKCKVQFIIIFGIKRIVFSFHMHFWETCACMHCIVISMKWQMAIK